MLTVAIKDNHEPKVIQLTYENLHKELKDIQGSDLCVVDHWSDAISRATSKKNNYICFVEADCLVNSGYFGSMLGLFKKNPYFRKLAMLASGTGVNNWGNKFYGYRLGDNYSDGIIPNREKKSNAVYPVQIGFVPGSIIRVNMLHHALSEIKLTNAMEDDLVYLSTQLSLAFWNQGDGNRVHINPNTTYVSTEDYINDIGKPIELAKKLKDKFVRESI